MLRKIKTALVLIFGVPALLFVGYVVISEYLHGDGKLLLLAPPASRMTVVIDGQEGEAVEAGYFRTVMIPQGKHKVSLTSAISAQEYDIEIDSGFQDLVLPADPQQCFAEIDVFDTYYSSSQDKPSLHETYSGAEPFEPAAKILVYPARIEGALPEKSYDPLYMLVAIPCELVDAEEEDVLAWIGYGHLED